MKKEIKIVLILILFGLKINAQSFSLDFESWTSTSPSCPIGWYGPSVSLQTSGAHGGMNYARVVTTTTNTGAMFTGRFINSTTYKSGVAFNQKPTSLNGFYKTSGLATGDSVMIYFISLSGNPSSLVTYGTFIETHNISTWTSFSIPLNYNGSLTPDTATVFVTSNPQTIGRGANSINSTLDVDDFSFSYSGATGVDEKTIGTSYLSFPNPSTDEFTILTKDDKAYNVVVTDLSGKLLNTTLIENSKALISLNNFSNGIYLYTILDKNKAVLFNSKLAVSK